MVSNCAVYLTNMLFSRSFASAFMNSLSPFSFINNLGKKQDKVTIDFSKTKGTSAILAVACLLFQCSRWTLDKLNHAHAQVQNCTMS